MAIWAAIRLWRRPGLGWTAAVGAAIGLAAASKVTALGLLPLAVVFGGTVLARRAREDQQALVPVLLKGGAALAGGFLLTLWTAYGLSTGEIQTNDLCGLGGGLASHTRFGPVPFPAWISGLLLQYVHGEGGHLSYLFGEVRSGGWWWFYLACLALKTTLGAQVAGVFCLSSCPDHLMFFNRWAGGPTGGPRHLIHGDDCGQDQRNLAEFMKNQSPWKLYYTFYNGSPGRWGLAWEPAPCEPKPGYYALHAVEVHRPKRMEAGCLDWLTVEPPDARIGYSIYFYQVTRARIERLLAERGKVAPFWESAGREHAGEEGEE